jgi:hypothetical protein
MQLQKEKKCFSNDFNMSSKFQSVDCLDMNAIISVAWIVTLSKKIQTILDNYNNKKTKNKTK